MSADSDAFKVIQQVPGLTPAEQQYGLSVFRGEGFYGLGWGNPSKLTIDTSAQFGIDPRAGVGSNNWGAHQGLGPAGSFPHIDFGYMVPDADGKPTRKHWAGQGPRVWGPYVAQYKKYNTPLESASDSSRLLFKPNLRQALATGIYKGKQVGPLEAAVYTQHDNGYYELKPEKYLEAVKRNYSILTAALQWPALLLKAAEEAAQSPLVGSSPPESEHCSISLPEAGFLRGQKYSVPGIQDEPEKK